ncbi:MAG: endonuclease III domain-containing protein [Acidobacteriota bacterium]|nr:endonuclease III domain-containing protein [Acidobacteriota bacterium]
MSPNRTLRAFYHALLRAWGPQNWWPAESRFEVIVGAFLTQNTAWRNVEQALAKLRSDRRLSVAGIRGVPLSRLQRLIRPAGYFRQKARRLKRFVAWLDANYGGSLARMFARPTAELRTELLALNGIGPETADSILLYAGGHPVFVVDAYTRRILDRHRVLPANAAYDDIRQSFERALLRASEPHRVGQSPRHPVSRMSATDLSPAARHYNQMHALLVAVGHQYCRKSEARCEQCPLAPFLPGR